MRGESEVQRSGTNIIHFYGMDVRGIRRHYAWLRKRLGNKKKLKIIKRIGQTEQRKVNDTLHKIAIQVVKEAKQHNALIIVGNLKGIRNNSLNKGKRFRRIVSAMPYFRLTEYIEYKANWEDIKVVKINERGTSHSCSICGCQGIRTKQSVFECQHCGLKDYNADLNSAINIAKRFSGQVLENGVELTQPITNQSG